MHQEILTKEQVDLLPLLSSFSPQFGLVGGTAIALQIGHRQSIDFDLFNNGQLDILTIRKKITGIFPIDQVRVENSDEYTVKVHGVQMTFYNFPFHLDYVVQVVSECKMPSLLTLAAMKAYALGKRAKWKDYVDLHFIFQLHSFEEVVEKTQSVFGNEFSEKLFREQLSYFSDIDKSEKIVYQAGFETDDAQILSQLTQLSVS